VQCRHRLNFHRVRIPFISTYHPTPSTGLLSGPSSRRVCVFPVRDSFVYIYFFLIINHMRDGHHRRKFIRNHDDTTDDWWWDDRWYHDDDHDHSYCFRSVHEPDNAEIPLNPSRRSSAQRRFTHIRSRYWYIIGLTHSRIIVCRHYKMAQYFLLTTFCCATLILL